MPTHIMQLRLLILDQLYVDQSTHDWLYTTQHETRITLYTIFVCQNQGSVLFQDLGYCYQGFCSQKSDFRFSMDIHKFLDAFNGIFSPCYTT